MNNIEAIAIKLCELDGLKWDNLKEKATNFTDGVTQSIYIGRAQEIASLDVPIDDGWLKNLLANEYAKGFVAARGIYREADSLQEGGEG